ncbi:MAG: hypothetical protein ACI9OH_000185 [Oleispira sp.]|jgi:hypothetical protein
MLSPIYFSIRIKNGDIAIKILKQAASILFQELLKLYQRNPLSKHAMPPKKAMITDGSSISKNNKPNDITTKLIKITIIILLLEIITFI